MLNKHMKCEMHKLNACLCVCVNEFMYVYVCECVFMSVCFIIYDNNSNLIYYQIQSQQISI